MYSRGSRISQRRGANCKAEGGNLLLVSARILSLMCSLISGLKCQHFLVQPKFSPDVSAGSGGVVVTGGGDLLSNFCSWVQKRQNPELPLSGVGGLTNFPTFVAEFKNDKKIIL